MVLPEVVWVARRRGVGYPLAGAYANVRVANVKGVCIRERVPDAPPAEDALACYRLMGGSRNAATGEEVE